jgi:ribosome maturation factor RimP
VQAVKVAQQLRERLTGLVEQAGYDLEDVVVTPAGKRRLVRLAVDKDGGVSLDECAELSRDVSAALDAAEDLLGQQPYTLEVGSPGVSRPLTLSRHWRRSVDRLVKVARHDGSTLTGRVISAEDESAVLDVDGAEVSLAYSDVAKAVVQVELNRGSHERGEG